MKTIITYKKRFFNLLESTMGDVRPLINEQTTTGCTDGNCTDGTGTYVYKNGNKYEGQFKDGRKNGTGTYFYKNGNKYEGQFKDGWQIKGTMTYNNGEDAGTNIKYIWNNSGESNGKFIYTSNNGFIFPTTEIYRDSDSKYFTDSSKKYKLKLSVWEKKYQCAAFGSMLIMDNDTSHLTTLRRKYKERNL